MEERVEARFRLIRQPTSPTSSAEFLIIKAKTISNKSPEPATPNCMEFSLS
jgi:hypothetical protein